MEKILILIGHLFLTHAPRDFCSPCKNKSANEQRTILVIIVVVVAFRFLLVLCWVCLLPSISVYASRTYTYEMDMNLTLLWFSRSSFRRVGEHFLFKHQSTLTSIPLSFPLPINPILVLLFFSLIHSPKYVFAAVAADHFSMLGEYSLSNSVCVLRTHHHTRMPTK